MEESTGRDRIHELIAAGRRLSDAPADADAQQVADVSNELIAFYDSPWNDDETRIEAAALVGSLAQRYPSVVRSIIESARRYVLNQRVDDAFPWSPNSFLVLSRLRPSSEEIVHFLELAVRCEWGIARWAALRALCEIDVPDAERIVGAVVRGDYPPRFSELQFDLKVIEEVKGRGFLEQNR